MYAASKKKENCGVLKGIISVANKRFSVGQWTSWRSEGHFEAPVGPGKLLIFTSKKHQKWSKLVLIYFVSHLYNVLSWEIIVVNWIDIMNIIFKKWWIRTSYPNIHLHINYAWSFQEICICFHQPRHPNGRQQPMTSHYLQRWYLSHTTTCLLGWWHTTLHKSIASEFCGEVCNCCMHLLFICQSRVTYKMFYVTTVNSSLQLLPNFCQKELHLRCYKGPKLNIVTQSTETVKGIRGGGGLGATPFPLTWLSATKQPWQNMKNSPSKTP